MVLIGVMEKNEVGRGEEVVGCGVGCCSFRQDGQERLFWEGDI